ncbi:hypothetical protein ABT040_18355 [Streptomyces sp. NPDC002688]|uniref:hypothetical protein n=1 Tax=Streptomyces sp. NPDC002688 TaxID=3154423 RepID=UPI0033261570
MSTDLRFDELDLPLRALRMLAVDFPGLPAPAVHVSTIYPKRLELSLYDDMGAFEPWRTALGIAPDAVEFREQGELTQVLEGSADLAGCDVRLIAYGKRPENGGTDA